MTSSAPQPAPYSPSPFTGGRHPHPWLLAAGIGQLVLSHIAFFGFVLVGLGLSPCLGTGRSGACGRELNSYDLAFWALLLNFVVAVLAVVLSRSRRAPVLYRALAAAIVISVGLGVVTGAALWRV